MLSNEQYEEDSELRHKVFTRQIIPRSAGHCQEYFQHLTIRGYLVTILIILLVILFAGGFGYFGHRQWGEDNGFAGPGIGLGTILVIVLVLYLLHII